MMTPRRKTPGGNRGPECARAGGNSRFDYNPLAQAAAKSLAREISIIMLAADKLASGHGLSFNDSDRLHQAHQHIIRVLADLVGKEVLQ